MKRTLPSEQDKREWAEFYGIRTVGSPHKRNDSIVAFRPMDEPFIETKRINDNGTVPKFAKDLHNGKINSTGHLKDF
jgi:hypothetical protein